MTGHSDETTTAIDQRELTSEQLEQVAGGLHVTKSMDQASPGLVDAGVGGPGLPPGGGGSSGNGYEQTLSLLMKAMGA